MSLRRLVLVFITILFIVGSVDAQGDSEDIHVGVVIQGVDGGQSHTFCVTLSDQQQTGYDALQATGLEIIADTGPMGSTVCRIAETGCTAPAENCFCECMGGDACAYWAYFHLGDSGNWQYSVQGAVTYALADGDVEGWWWRDDADSLTPLPVISFEDICSSRSEFPEFPRSVTDGLGREVVIDSPPQRIASVSLAADEMLLDLVGPERLLGVTYFAGDSAISNIADRLEGIKRADLIGNPELLISLNADLIVLSTYNNPAALDQLLDAGVPVFVLEGFESLADIRANLRMLGRVTGEDARAEALISEMDSDLLAVQLALSGYDPVRVLYYEPGGITYGPGSTVDAIITLAGGRNVIAESDLGAYPLINPEYVIVADPDVILLGGWFGDEDDPLAWITHDPVLSSLRAVQLGHVYPVNDAHLTTVSHYVVRGVEEIAALLYPAAFDEN